MNFKQLVLMNLQALTNFPYIEKDFDAVTDYELLCLVVDHLNEVIKNSNEQNTVIQNLYNAFVALKDYVDNYFENLDIQEEVDNKLDEMVKDGTFNEIINQELFNELNTKINKSLILNESEDNTSINNKFKNINITLHNYNDTTLYDIELLNIDELKLLPTGGSKSNPKSNRMNILSFSKTNTNYDLYINGGVFSDSTFDTWGYCIFDGIPYDGGFGTPDYYVGLDENNNLMTTNSNEIDNVEQLVNLGYKNCCGSFAPFIINGEPVNISAYIDEVYTTKQPRQIMYQKNDNSLHILSIIGRNPFNQGLTYTDVQNYLSTKNVKIAINLDGGGSVQSVYKKRKLFETQDSNLKDGRTVTNAFVVKIGGEF